MKYCNGLWLLKNSCKYINSWLKYSSIEFRSIKNSWNTFTGMELRNHGTTIAADSLAWILISWMRDCVAIFWSNSSWTGTQLFLVTVVVILQTSFEAIGCLVTKALPILLPRNIWRNIVDNDSFFFKMRSVFDLLTSCKRYSKQISSKRIQMDSWWNSIVLCNRRPKLIFTTRYFYWVRCKFSMYGDV